MKTILLFGGASDERMVSVASAQNLIQNFDFSELWFLKETGQVFRISKTDLSQHKNPFKVSFVPTTPAFAKSIYESGAALQGHVLFLGLHGTEGEDGAFQEFFEKNKIPFTGSGSQASKLCFEKNLAKEKVAKEGIRVASEKIWKLEENQNLEALLSPFLTAHFKIVLKPVANGSSIGLHIVKTQEELKLAADQIKKSGSRYMAEEFIEGRELTVGVLEKNGEVFPLTPSEVLLNSTNAFDYDGKYLGVGTTEVTPALLNENEKKEAQRIALVAHKILGCRGYSRTDLILTKKGIVFIETNTLPGLTKASFYPQQLNDVGISMTSFINSQLEVATQKM